nr:helix-turn-helix domain-containing protein [Hydrococcus rivularis]
MRSHEDSPPFAIRFAKKGKYADITFQCGFNSHSHLAKWFRDLTGMTPKAYRKSHL